MAERIAASYWRRVWDTIGHLGTLYTLCTLAAAFVVTAKKVAHMPSNWYAPQYWVSAGAWLFGTLAIAAILATVARKTISWLKRWMRPHSIELRIESGRVGALTLIHHGEVATWRAEGRIMRTLDGSPNEDPLLFQCYFLRDKKIANSMSLKEGESATIILANIGRSEWRSGSWLQIRCGDYGNNTTVTDAGVVMEVNIRSDPASKRAAVCKEFEIKRSINRPDLIEVIELG